MLHIGCHLSAAKGYLNMGKDALAIGADTFQFFARNPRGGRAKAPDEKDFNALTKLAAEHHFAPLLAHAPYTLNPCSPDEKVRDFARLAFREDLGRLADYFPGCMYNFHPGSHVGQGVETGIDLIAQLLDEVLLPEHEVPVLLETMSGKGSEVGASFEELAEIIRRVKRPERLGVCLDTCHVYSAGYDLVNRLDDVLEEFDRIIGLNRLRAVHLNDSMTPFSSRKDRHACVGQGSLGLDALVRIIRHPLLRGLPFYLETPNELEGHAAEIALMRKKFEEE